MKKLAQFLIVFSFTLPAFAAHSVLLSCTASTSTGVTGYNFYRGATSGGESNTPLNASPTATCSYTDTSVIATQTYFYVAKAFCPTCNPSLSIASNEVSGTIPADPQPNPPTSVTLVAQ